MAKIIKFVYVTIIIFFLFFASNNVASVFYRCSNDAGCPPYLCQEPKTVKCVRKWCRCVAAAEEFISS
ncbi:unnamed protein product [Lathyrus oleraceus]